MADKTFVTPQSLLDDSFRLGLKIMEDGFHPDYIIGIWRGGTPVGIAVQELLNYHGYPSDHIAIRTSSYAGIEQQNDEIRVHGLHYIIENVNAENSVLIVDDVFDTGRSIMAVLERISGLSRRNAPEIIRLAVMLYGDFRYRRGTSRIFCMSAGLRWATRRSGSGGTASAQCSPPRSGASGPSACEPGRNGSGIWTRCS